MLHIGGVVLGVSALCTEGGVGLIGASAVLGVSGVKGDECLGEL